MLIGISMIDHANNYLKLCFLLKFDSRLFWVAFYLGYIVALRNSLSPYHDAEYKSRRMPKTVLLAI